MRLTATQLVTFWTCPFLWHVSYERKEPLRAWGSRRRFGTVIHAAIAVYERQGRALGGALAFLDSASGLPPEDLIEARSILAWRDSFRNEERSPKLPGQAPIPGPRAATSPPCTPQQQSPASGEQAWVPGGAPPDDKARRATRPLLVEGSLRAQIGGHRLEVRMDRLDILPDGALHLVELKGGKRVDLPQVLTQLRILSAAIHDVFGRAPATWELEQLRARRVEALPAETDPVKLRAFTAGLMDRLRGGDREPRPQNPGFCKSCPARAHCPKVSPEPKPFTREAPLKETAQLSLL